LVLSRKKAYTPDNLTSLIHLFKNLGVTHVLVTGDLSSTSRRIEFERAQHFISSLQAEGLQAFCVPGNHDQYTRRVYKNQLFYDYFDRNFSDAASSLPPSVNLKDDKVSARYLGNQWWLIGIDTALATPLLSASGSFSPLIEENLTRILETIPSDHQVILMNHFPIFKSSSPRNQLYGREKLQALLNRFPQIRLYLHGHTHRHSIADLRSQQLPIILDSGSTAHKMNGTWNLLEIDSSGCRVQGYQWRPASQEISEEGWAPLAEHHFTW
jgi:3',5'-cyclic AMP phosphodiesterase CpdA